jgi:hypothetical protein
MCAKTRKLSVLCVDDVLNMCCFFQIWLDPDREQSQRGQSFSLARLHPAVHLSALVGCAGKGKEAQPKMMKSKCREAADAAWHLWVLRCLHYVHFVQARVSPNLTEGRCYGATEKVKLGTSVALPCKSCDPFGAGYLRFEGAKTMKTWRELRPLLLV